jgi:hypothetical protein
MIPCYAYILFYAVKGFKAGKKKLSTGQIKITEKKLDVV